MFLAGDEVFCSRSFAILDDSKRFAAVLAKSSTGSLEKKSIGSFSILVRYISPARSWNLFWSSMERNFCPCDYSSTWKPGWLLFHRKLFNVIEIYLSPRCSKRVLVLYSGIYMSLGIIGKIKLVYPFVSGHRFLSFLQKTFSRASNQELSPDIQTRRCQKK